MSFRLCSGLRMILRRVGCGSLARQARKSPCADSRSRLQVEQNRLLIGEKIQLARHELFYLTFGGSCTLIFAGWVNGCTASWSCRRQSIFYEVYYRGHVFNESRFVMAECSLIPYKLDDSSSFFPAITTMLSLIDIVFQILRVTHHQS